MRLPTVPESLARWEEMGIISAADAVLYRANYEHFEKNRKRIHEQFPSKWVASIDGMLYIRPTQKELQADIENKPNSRFAYIEEVIFYDDAIKIANPTPLTARDFLQTYLLSEQEVLNSVKEMTPKEDDMALAVLQEHIEKRVQEVEMSAQITTVIRLLMLQGLKDEDIVAWGRLYLTKYVSSSVPIWQVTLKSIETMPTLPNNETELRGIRLAKDICASLIQDFGKPEMKAAE